MTDKNNSLIQSLIEIGISKLSAQVYFEILTKKKYTISSLSKEFSVHRQKIYDSFQELKTSNIFKDGQIISPKEVFALLNKKQAELKNTAKNLEEILPEYLNYYYSDQNQSLTQIYQGESQFLQLYYKFLGETDGILLSIGNIQKFVDMVGISHMKMLIEIRIKNNIQSKMIMIHNHYIEELLKHNQSQLREVKFLDDKYDTDCFIWINGDSVSIWNPSIPRATLINDPVISQFFTQIHRFMWDKL